MSAPSTVSSEDSPICPPTRSVEGMPGTSCTLGVSRAKSRKSLPLSGRVAIAVWLTVVLAKTLEVSTIGVSAVDGEGLGDGGQR